MTEDGQWPESQGLEEALGPQSDLEKQRKSYRTFPGIAEESQMILCKRED